jgi:hypothetical protein
VTEVRVTTSLSPRDVLRVSFSLIFVHPVSVALMAGGPVLLVVGLLAGSQVVERLGSTMAWLVVLVPAWALLSATWSAFRPEAAAVYESADWTFREEATDVARSGGSARAEWDEFTGWRSVAGCLLLHTTPSHYVVIPWRDVPEGSREGLERLLTAKIGRRKR